MSTGEARQGGVGLCGEGVGGGAGCCAEPWRSLAPKMGQVQKREAVAADSLWRGRCVSEASVYVHVCPGLRANVRMCVLSWGRGPEEPTAHRMGKMAAY